MLTFVVDVATHALSLFQEHPYLVLLIVLTLEEAGLPLPLPGDLLILVAGAAIASGQLDPVLTVACIIVATVTGSSILYTIGRLGGRPVLRRFGGFFRLTPARVTRMEGWLGEHPSAVIWSRLVPGLRVVTSFAAGALRLRLPLFLLAIALSALLWAGVYLTAGALLGSAAVDLVDQVGDSLWLAVAGLAGLALVVGLLLRHLRRHRGLWSASPWS
jgi:membrane-associated protein